MSLTNFRSLGRSGLIVSPLALGTMTFGAKGYGSADDVSAAVFNAYVDAGGNFVDTADIYGGGRSEELVGRLTAGRSLRDNSAETKRDRTGPVASSAAMSSMGADPPSAATGSKLAARTVSTLRASDERTVASALPA